MATANIPFPVNFAAGVTGVLLSPADGTVTNAKVASGAAIDSAKMLNRYRPAAKKTGTEASETVVIYVATASGTVLDFNVVNHTIAIGGGANVTYDLKKNGTTILSAVVTMNSSSVAYIAQAGTISGNTYVAGDVYTVVKVATTGGGTLPANTIAQMTVDENPV